MLYVGVLGAHWLLLRDLPHGTQWVLMLLAVTFATDTGAYVTGKLGVGITTPARFSGKRTRQPETFDAANHQLKN